MSAGKLSSQICDGRACLHDVIGPEPTSTTLPTAATQLHQSGYSYVVQNCCWLEGSSADIGRTGLSLHRAQRSDLVEHQLGNGSSKPELAIVPSATVVR